MKGKRKLHLRSLFLYLMIGFSSVMLLFVGCYMLLFHNFYRVLEQNTIESEQIRFESVKNYLENEIEKAQYIMTQINLDPDLFPLLNRGNLSDYDYFKANVIFSNRFARTNYVEYRKNLSELIVMTRSTQNDMLLSINGSYHADTFFQRLYPNETYTQDFWYGEMKDDFYFRLYPVETFSSNSFWKEESRRILPAALKTNQNHIIICLIDFDRLLSDLEKTLGTEALEEFSLFSEETGLVYSTMMNGTDEWEQMEEISGFESIRKGGEGYYFREASQYSGIWYERYMEEEIIFAELFTIMVNYLVVFGLLLLAGILIAVWISIRLNMPVKEMAKMVEDKADKINFKGGALTGLRDSMAEIIRQKEQYRQDIESQQSILKEMFYKSRIQNIYMDYESISREIEGEYRLLLFQIHYRNREDENNARYTFMLKELIALYVKPFFPETVVFQNEEDIIACVFHAFHTDEEVQTMLQAVLAKLDSEKEIAFFTIAACPDQADITKIQFLYNQAVLYAERRLPLAASQIVDEKTYKKSVEKFYLSMEQTQLMLQMLQTQEEQKIRQALVGIYEYNSRKNVNCLYLGLLTEHLLSLCTKELFGKSSIALNFNAQLNMISVRDQFKNAIEAEDFIEIAFRQIMSLIHALQMAGTEEKEDYIISFLQSYVEKNYEKEIYLNLLAEELKLSPAYVSSYFKEKTGIGLMDYINRYKIERASSLLLDTTKKVKEVAECVGIFNVNTFIRLFKKYKDVTPNEYRRKTQEFKDSPLGALPRGESETIS